jgi:predicted metalloprotease with PDZ domain
MWQKLYDGYRRGVADTRFRGKPLREVSDGMRYHGGFMRVYWSGAWYFLAADVRLRQQSGGRLSLDQALGKLNTCCADDSLSAPAIVRKLDEMNRVILFGSLYRELAESREIPAYEPIFAGLGISVQDGKVSLQQQGPGVDLRRSIAMGDPL